MYSLFIFRRDLRIDDNTGLIKALTGSTLVLPCFIFDPEQIRRHGYFSINSFKFMVESLLDLKLQLERRGGRLYFFKGSPHKIVKELIEKKGIKGV